MSSDKTHMPTILKSKPYSNHPGDAHLQVVLAQNFKGEYVTWCHNTQDNGFFCGHYFNSDYDRALADFDKRPY